MPQHQIILIFFYYGILSSTIDLRYGFQAAAGRNGTRNLTVLFKIAERGFQRAIDDCVI
jgi:hypothetical protein